MVFVLGVKTCVQMFPHSLPSPVTHNPFQMEDSDYILTEVCVGLRSHRNRFAPIDRLPPEIFSYIFEYVVQPDSDRTVKSQKAATERIPEMWALLALSQVCSRWRAIALQTPTLWTHVDNRHEATLEAYLNRSGTMPLRLHMFPGMPNERSTLR